MSGRLSVFLRLIVQEEKDLEISKFHVDWRRETGRRRLLSVYEPKYDLDNKPRGAFQQPKGTSINNVRGSASTIPFLMLCGGPFSHKLMSGCYF